MEHTSHTSEVRKESLKTQILSPSLHLLQTLSRLSHPSYGFFLKSVFFFFPLYLLLQIDAHEDDVNAVAFADSSSQLLFSGSDDALCKVWDRRTLREDRPQPVGHLAGHRDGITFIHSKVGGREALINSLSLFVSHLLFFSFLFQGDARYLISNSKDQSIKLWDIRKFSPKEGLAASRQAVTQQNWDYRWQQVPQRGEERWSCWE